MDVNNLALSIALDKSSDVPIFVQIRDYLTEEIRAGKIPAGDKLPPVRLLAAALNVNMMTVAKAYSDLKQEGLVSGRGALGTFVNEHCLVQEHIQNSVEDARASYSGVDSDTFARMQQVSARVGITPLTQAYPDAERVDVGAFEYQIKLALDTGPSCLYSYIQPDGLPSLRSSIAELISSERGFASSPDELLITSGGQQSLSLVSRTLLQSGDRVIVERPTYFGALDLFRSMGVEPIGVPMENDGIEIDALERAIQQHSPRLMFVMPTFHNPTGISMSLEKRNAVLSLSRKYGVPILEDDCCAELRYVEPRVSSIRALASSDDDVYYFSSMGKVFVPGLRLGFVAAPTKAIASVVRQKSVADLHTSPLTQVAFDGFLRSGKYKSSLDNLRNYYGDLQGKVLKQLAECMPNGAEWTKPDGGLNIWFRLPEGVNSIDFFYACLQRDVSILVGLHFFSDAPDERSVRLSFGLSDEARVLAAVRAMSEACRDLLSKSVPRFPVLV